jgi:hypothetical protein
VTSNYTGAFHEADDDALIERLAQDQQISGTVRWRSNMEALAARAAGVHRDRLRPPAARLFKTSASRCRRSPTCARRTASRWRSWLNDVRGALGADPRRLERFLASRPRTSSPRTA